MVQKRYRIFNKQILIIGITSKEKSLDIRNMETVDILTTWGDLEEVKHDYNKENLPKKYRCKLKIISV